MDTHTIYLALGSNLGDRRANLIDAINQLRQHVQVEQISSVYETEPAYVTEQPRFLNIALRGSTQLGPRDLLRLAKGIERRMGRAAGPRFGPRPIDIDILAYDDITMNLPDLVIPHPRIDERAFVLEPLAEIAPDLVLPGRTASVAALAAQLGRAGILRVTPGLAAHFTRDVQDEPPQARLSLTRVGVSAMKRIVRLTTDTGDVPFFAEMDLFVELKPDQKGAHMSRFSDTVEDVIAGISATRAPRLELLAGQIAREILRDQRAVRSDVHIRAQVPQHRHAPVSGKLTQEIYTLIGMAAATRERVVRLVGVEAEGMMACPCAQDMVASHARERLLEAGFSEADADRALAIVPVATHNQRGRGTLIVGTDAVIDARELIHVVEQSMSSENYDLLKRADELFVVTKAHRQPRFVEDAVREMLAGLIERYPELPDDAFVLSRQRNMETIHKHDVYAERAGTLGEIRHELAGTNVVQPHTTLDAWLRAQLHAPHACME